MTDQKDDSDNGVQTQASDRESQGPANQATVSRSRQERLARLRERSSAYSLDSLAKKSAVSLPVEEDPPVSGTINLRELPKSSDAQPSLAILDSLPALASPEPESDTKVAEVAAPKSKSTALLAVALGLGGVTLAVAAFVIWKPPTPPTPAASPIPIASASETESKATVHASASSPPVQSSFPDVATPTPKPITRGPRRAAPSASAKESAADQTEPIAGSELTTAPEPTATVPPKPKPPSSPCGCKPDDLKCNIDCAVKGK